MRWADGLRRRDLKTTAAKRLRLEMTEPERTLWVGLRNRRFAGFRFRRQQPIGPYIADFFCASAKVIVELDGGQHGEDARVAYDEARTRFLNQQGFHVVRFSNEDLLKQYDAVMDGIWHALRQASDPSPKRLRRFDPPSRGG